MDYADSAIHSYVVYGHTPCTEVTHCLTGNTLGAVPLISIASVVQSVYVCACERKKLFATPWQLQ